MATFTGTSGNNTANAFNGTLNGFSGGTSGQLQDSTGDTFLGLGGIDTVIAGSGDDVISGGEGDDVLYGNGGDDTFTLAQGMKSELTSSAAAQAPTRSRSRFRAMRTFGTPSSHLLENSPSRSCGSPAPKT